MIKFCWYSLMPLKFAKLIQYTDISSSLFLPLTTVYSLLFHNRHHPHRRRNSSFLSCTVRPRSFLTPLAASSISGPVRSAHSSCWPSRGHLQVYRVPFPVPTTTIRRDAAELVEQGCERGPRKGPEQGRR